MASWKVCKANVDDANVPAHENWHHAVIEQAVEAARKDQVAQQRRRGQGGY
jgi:hypothetical protein